MPSVFINNAFYDEKQAVVSVFDHGFLYGDGIFETLRSYAGRIFRARDHLARLSESARAISLKIPWSTEELLNLLHECLRVNRSPHALLRLSISRGVGPAGLDPDLCSSPTTVVLTRPFIGYPEHDYAHGISIALVSVLKNHPRALDPRIKSTNFLNNILARIEAKKLGATEAILLNPDGFLAEGTVSNIFFQKDGILCTPAAHCGILEGISRKVVLEIATDAGIPFQEGSFRPPDLLNASEIFLTNTSYEVMPVTRVHDRTLTPGPVTGRVRDLFRIRVQHG